MLIFSILTSNKGSKQKIALYNYVIYKEYKRTYQDHWVRTGTLDPKLKLKNLRLKKSKPNLEPQSSVS